MAEDEPPFGPKIDAHAAPLPERRISEGRTVRLAPREAAQADDLFAGSHGNGAETVWTYLGDGPFPDRETFRASIAKKATSDDPLFYAILDKASGRALGHLTLMRIEPTQRVVEIGNILYTPTLQRTVAATEALYLIAGYVFDLGYRRFEWKCNDLNAPSKRAAVRYGFTFEGVFRQHMIVKGRNRDTAWFAMLDHEWPARKAAFEAWLSPENFGPDGIQKQSLGALMGLPPRGL